MRLLRFTILLAGTILAGSLALAGHTAHLDSTQDRAAFRRWFTFLAESRYYARKPLREISDGESLIRWAMRNALAPHDRAWSKSLELPVYPAMRSVPNSAAASTDYETAFVSADTSAAQPGDLLLFENSHLPAYVMVYIGSSQNIPSSWRWVIYWASGKVHKVPLDALLDDASSEWRPTPENPDFRGVWRLDILSDID
ncbi:MAG: uncharacterized protein QOJ99_1196 [Bryobacterales bacterium]|nr:uncharacterized protein [Bryobacterales bacterium]